MVVQWKQRLYAFLLRRILSPYLSPTSLKKLHESIEVSFQDGIFTFKDVDLNASYLTSKLQNISASSYDKDASSFARPIAIRKARIRKLEIHLSLQESSRVIREETSSNIRQASVAWRAFQLGRSPSAVGESSSSAPRISLIAHVEIDGLDIEIEPAICQETPAVPPVPPVESSARRSSYVSSYVDAAMSSLKLSIHMSNLTLLIGSSSLPLQESSPLPHYWVEFRLSKAYYHDVELSNASPDSSRSGSNYETVLHKGVDFSGILVETGETIYFNDENGIVRVRNPSKEPLPIIIGRAEGSGQAMFRAIAYSNLMRSRTEASVVTSQAEEDLPPPQVQQDIEVSLNMRFEVSVNDLALQRIDSVMKNFGKDTQLPIENQRGPSMRPCPSGVHIPTMERTHPFDQVKEDESVDQDIHAVHGMMKHYYEARKLAETKHLRGGILLPSSAFQDSCEAGLDDDQDVTFDTFFDANDQSFSYFNSVIAKNMVQSMIGSEAERFVHTKVKLHLLAGSVKVSFPRRDVEIADRQHFAGSFHRTAEEYLLLTFSDINATASLSNCTSELIISISHVEIEDSLVEISSLNERADIGSVLRFKESDTSENISSSSVVSQAPCISLDVSSRRTKEETKEYEVNINLEPLTIMFRKSTMSNMTNFIEQARKGGSKDNANTNIEASAMNNDESDEKNTRIRCYCPSVTLALPIDGKVINEGLEREKRANAELFARCGYTLEGVHAVQKPSLGIALGELSLDVTRRPSQQEECGMFSCDHLVFFATSSSLGRTPGIKRIDILACSGRVEVEPHVPISFQYRKVDPHNEYANHGRKAFPIVPMLSTFKARQDDEDQEIEDMYNSMFKSTKMAEMESISALRGANPQDAMLLEAEKCEAVVELHIPNITGDLTRSEGLALLQMITSTITTTNRDSAKPKEHDKHMNASAQRARRIGIAIKCDQAFLCVHELLGTVHGVSSEEWYSYALTGELVHCHAVVVSELKCIRMLANDVNLFEIRKLVDPGFAENVYRNSSIHECYNSVRDRTVRNPSSTAVPILYRSHMFPPISPESPAILVDMLSADKDGTLRLENFSEWSVHLTAYSMTHRYRVASSWMEHLVAVLKVPQNYQSPCDISGEEDNFPTVTQSSKNAVSSKLTKLFISLVDCNLDYTPPAYFKTSSRVILRLGDFRLSSNLLSPAGKIQAYRCSLNDLAVHLANYRCPYNNEYSHLASASILLNPNDIAVKPQVHIGSGAAPETILQTMGFINVATLDSMEALLTTANSKASPCYSDSHATSEPHVTINVSFGSLFLYTCKDSFVCLTETIREWQLKVTALNEEAFQALKVNPVAQKATIANAAAEIFFDTLEGYQDPENTELGKRDFSHLDSLIMLSPPLTDIPADEPILGKSHTSFDQDIPTGHHSSQLTDQNASDEFLLDGYDWTTLDHECIENSDLDAGEEQSAMWYAPSRINIIQQHVPVNHMPDPLSKGDMQAQQFASTATAPQIQTMLLIRNLSLRCRFFDGYDWPTSRKNKNPRNAHDSRFIIEEVSTPPEGVKEGIRHGSDANTDDSLKADEARRKAKLIGDLMVQDHTLAADGKKTFDGMPLPEERGEVFESLADLRRLSRRTHRFFQISTSGVKLRLDSLVESPDHRLASCMELKLTDMFFAETISNSKPIKMLGEWFNDTEHPRDSDDGLVMMKMVTWHPANRVSKDNEIANDESLVKLELLPLRCYLNQRTMRFVSIFFSGETDEETPEERSFLEAQHLKAVPPPFFKCFKVKTTKLKVNYRPEKIDISALCDGSYVELINLSPLEDMVIMLQPVCIKRLIGFSATTKELLRQWIQDVCATQIYKFVANATPFQPLVHVGGGLADLVILPWESIKQGGVVHGNMKRAVRSGVHSFGKSVVYETLNTSSKLTQFAAQKLMGVLSSPSRYSASTPLPSRPHATPRGFLEVMGHAGDSVAHGLYSANYKVVIIPCREYRNSGAMGAAKSVVRGIPVAVMAPIGGVAEAVSYTLLGVRNQMNPEIRKEEEASQRGLQHRDF